MPLVFLFSLDPLAKLRPRFSRGHVFTPMKTKRYEQHIAVVAAAQMIGLPLEGPIHARIKFVFKRKKSVKRTHHTIKPDLDNLIKAILDGLNGIAFKDDAQVCSLSATKVYGVDDEDGRITIELHPMDATPSV